MAKVAACSAGKGRDGVQGKRDTHAEPEEAELMKEWGDWDSMYSMADQFYGLQAFLKCSTKGEAIQSTGDHAVLITA